MAVLPSALTKPKVRAPLGALALFFCYLLLEVGPGLEERLCGKPTEWLPNPAKNDVTEVGGSTNGQG